MHTLVVLLLVDRHLVGKAVLPHLYGPSIEDGPSLINGPNIWGGPGIEDGPGIEVKALSWLLFDVTCPVCSR